MLFNIYVHKIICCGGPRNRSLVSAERQFGFLRNRLLLEFQVYLLLVFNVRERYVERSEFA